jgi:hypothetical protein
MQSSLDTRQKLFNDKKIQEMAVAKSEFELAKTQYQLTQSEQQRKNDRLEKLAVALTLLLALSYVLFLFFRQRNHRRLLEQQNMLLAQDKKLLAQEKELAEAREILKNQELEHSQRILKNTQEELTTTTSRLSLKDRLIEELELRLHQEYIAPDETLPPGSAENQELPRMKILTEKDWARFRERFEQQLPGFFQNLKVTYPSLTTAEVRLFLLLKLNFDILEISEALGISKESVWRSRHRLSKKLGLSETGDLNTFVQQFG